MLTGLRRAFLFLALWALAAAAHASYGQMRLEGVALSLVFMFTVAYGVFVDFALFVRMFRYRAALVIGSLVALAVIVLYPGLTASPSERAGFFKMFSGGSGPLVLVVIGAVFLPFIVIAPFAQYRAMRDGRRWPDWIVAWMAVQLAWVPGFIALAVTDQYFWQREYADAQAQGIQVKAGELGALLEHAKQKKERIWGTGWNYPWSHDGTTGSSGWPLGLALGLDASELLATNEPLSEPDRAALQELMERYLWQFAGPHIRAKLLWDALEPGGFSRLDPVGVSEEMIPVLLERLEKDGNARICPGGRMLDTDRAALTALVLDKGRVWSVEKQAYEMRAGWDSYPQRVERLCQGPG